MSWPSAAGDGARDERRARFLKRWGRESDVHERYTAALRRLLGRNASAPSTLLPPRERRFLADHDGDGTGLTRERVVGTLYYDFVVSAELAALERRYGITGRVPDGLGSDGDAPTSDGYDDDVASGDEDGFAVDDRRAIHERVAETAGFDDVDAFVAAVAPADGDEAVHSNRITPPLLRALYADAVPRGSRLALGEYDTPRGLAELAVGTLDVDDPISETFLDPGCGVGTFLTVCIARKRGAMNGTRRARESTESSRSAAAIVDAITATVYGIDVNPVAVRGARLAYLAALGSLLDDDAVTEVTVPVVHADALGLRDTDEADESAANDGPPTCTVDHLVGNPPWITWSGLPDRTKAAWRRTHVGRLDLQAYHGRESLLGYGNDDVSVPFVWTCLDRYLAPGGDAAVVLKRNLLTGPAGRLFRRGQVGDRPVSMETVHDFGSLHPFGDEVNAGAAVYGLRADATTTFPVEATAWTRGEETPRFESAATIRASLCRERAGVRPVEPDDPASPWIAGDVESRALGECHHRIRHGVKDDAKTVFSLDRDRLVDLEPDHVYPYLRSRHVVKYGLFGHDLQLVPLSKVDADNETELRRETPRTYGYLDENRETLEGRSSSWFDSGPFYNLFGLGEYTWADYKVVWCRLGFKPHFAVVSTVDDPDLGEKPVVPGDHCMFLATDDEHEAHFLCALLNSAVYQRSIEGLASEGKSGIPKAIVDRLELPAYRETERHRRLAELSMEAHGIVPRYVDRSKRAYNALTIEELEPVQAAIDDAAAALLADHED